MTRILQGLLILRCLALAASFAIHVPSWHLLRNVKALSATALGSVASYSSGSCRTPTASILHSSHYARISLSGIRVARRYVSSLMMKETSSFEAKFEEGRGTGMQEQNLEQRDSISRRKMAAGVLLSGFFASSAPTQANSENVNDAGSTGALKSGQAAGGTGMRRGDLFEVSDPETYSALAYSPPPSAGIDKKLPLIIVLHGAGKNENDVWNLADIKGEHAGLIPSLIASGRAPRELTENFAVVAPYSAGKRSFYEEPRKKVLNFVQWVSSAAGRQAGCPDIDPNRVFLFGFSDGATVGVELLTTGRFFGGIICAYGFTGELPPLAVQRLKDLPIWVFHSADDVIFPVSCSDRLVKALRGVDSMDVVKYSRFERDQEGFTGSVRGHSTGITASKDPQLYTWLLSLR